MFCSLVGLQGFDGTFHGGGERIGRKPEPHEYALPVLPDLIHRNYGHTLESTGPWNHEVCSATKSLVARYDCSICTNCTVK